jgi:hypothetical protein
MNASSAAAFVGIAGFVLCLIPIAASVWGAREHVRAARRLDRLMIATSALAFPIVLSVLDPDAFSAPMFAPRVPLLGLPAVVLVQGSAVIAYVVGLAWMVRIHRTSHLEPEGCIWRYRDSFG